MRFYAGADLENVWPHCPHFMTRAFQRSKIYAELAFPILVCPASAERLNNVSNTVVKNITFIGFIMEHTWILIVTF
jgi:hypothetical protein